MRHLNTGILILLITGCIWPGVSDAQMLAGSIPPGTSIHYPNISLADSTSGSPVSDSLDVNCDGIDDLALELLAGNPSIDWAHTLWIRVLNSSVEIWRDTGYHNNMVPFYNYGDTMCMDAYQWRSDSITQIACGNAFCFPTVSEATDTFIAIRNSSTQQVGWLKISYEIFASWPIVASVSEALQFCDESGMQDMITKPLFSVHTDPANDGIVHISSKALIQKFEVKNVVGQVLEIVTGNKRVIYLPQPRGVYVITAFDEDGRQYAKKIIRK